ncbi:MAG: UDP-N-acetylmuramoylalanyl-D-glutamyl-2, 6-diaminopimelate--D-alanyl-D-alanine ligase, partial [Elioraea tepidiphila]
MSPPRIALLAPGEMGAAVGARLIAHGARVTTCLAGRGARIALRLPGGTGLLIDESYNANPASMAAA